jgi:triosephosphate isomerase
LDSDASNQRKFHTDTLGDEAVVHSMERSEPFLLINFKTYLEATGKRAVELSRRVEKVAEDAGVKVGVAPQFCDLEQVAANVDIPVFAQHIDPISPGASTGHVLAESVKAAGADGTLINHSERPLPLAEIDRAVQLAKQTGLRSVVCAGTARLAAAVALCSPEMVAIEPPELIGTGRAVSKENPEIVTASVKMVRKVNSSVGILCGAGISTGDDVFAALTLGTDGILVASGVVKAANPEKVLASFCEAAVRPA